MNKEGFNIKKFKDLYHIEEKSFWFISRNNIIIYLFEKYYSEMSSFMEIGCGTGFVLSGIQKKFRNCKIKGTELFDEGIIFAKKRLANIDFEQLDAIELNEIEKYDCIGAFDVLEHIERDDVVLTNLYRACKKGVLLTVPQHKFMWSKMDEEACHVRRYSKVEIVTKLIEAGFKVEFSTSFVSLLFPFMFLSRMLNKGEYSEFNISKSLNAFFMFIMNIEFQMIKKGLKFPFGGSLIIVAKKYN